MPSVNRKSAPVLEHVGIFGAPHVGPSLAKALRQSGCAVTFCDAGGADTAPFDTRHERPPGVDVAHAMGDLNHCDLVIVLNKPKTVDRIPEQVPLALSTGAYDVLPAVFSDRSDIFVLPDPYFLLQSRCLEVCRLHRTTDHTMNVARELARRLNRVPVFTKGTVPVSDCLLARYQDAADMVFMDGSTPWEVDEALQAFGFASGPFEAQDIDGLDLSRACLTRWTARQDPQRRRVPIAERMFELGKLGIKTGAGWYRYPGGRGKVDDPIVADLANEESYLAKRERDDYSPAQIVERILLALICEAVDALQCGAAATPADLDVLSILSLGFPESRGGVLRYADALGAKYIVDRLASLALEDPEVWNISPLLRACARSDQPILDYEVN
jgi:3-hydroxyacyl-CoA dehydrogenase